MVFSNENTDIALVSLFQNYKMAEKPLITFKTFLGVKKIHMPSFIKTKGIGKKQANKQMKRII